MGRTQYRAYGALVGLVLCLLASSAWAGQLDVSWSAPTTNTDGSALTDLATYRVYYFLFPNTPCPGTQFLVVNAPSPTPSPSDPPVMATLTSLTQGMTYNAAVTAVDTSGNESACSNVASAAAHADPPLPPGTTLKIAYVPDVVGPPASVNFGDQNTEATNAGNLGGVLDAQQTTLPVAGTLQSIAVFVATPSGRLTLAIYDSTGPSGAPGKLLAQTQAIAPVAGWNIAPTLTTPSLAAGTYWLAVTVDNNAMVLRRVASGSSRRAFSFTAPSTFPSSSPLTQTYSLYGTVTVP